MNAEERAHARAQLIRGISIPDLINDLEGNRYGDLVLEHLRKGREQLASTIHVHEQVMEPEDREACAAVISAHTAQADTVAFWGESAGDILNSISCDLNDELLTGPADDASIFVCFQLTTLRLAFRAADDQSLRVRIASTPLAAPQRGGSGTITKMLGIAISDFDAGRLQSQEPAAHFPGRD